MNALETIFKLDFPTGKGRLFGYSVFVDEVGKTFSSFTRFVPLRSMGDLMLGFGDERDIMEFANA